MTESPIKIAAKADGHRNMVRERHEDRVRPGSREKRGMNEPIEVTAVFLRRAGGMSDSTVPVPLGREIQGGDVPIPSDEPWYSPNAGECVLKLIEEAAPDFICLGKGAGWPINRKEVQALCPGPRDDGMSTPV